MEVVKYIKVKIRRRKKEIKNGDVEKKVGQKELKDR